MQHQTRRAFLPAVLAALSACTAENARTSAADTTPAMDSAMTAQAPPMATPDAQMKAVLDQLASLGGKPIETLTPAEARQQPTPADAVKKVLEAQGKPTTPDPAVASVDRTINTASGSLPVRIYTPTSGAGPFPVIVYYHGGGWVIADKVVYDGGARGLSKLANAVVVSPDYRRGPESKFPAAHDDAYAAYEWALANAASIKGDPKRIALAGESAGGNLAVSTAIMARDRKAQMPTGIVAVYPVAGTDPNTPSANENAMAKPLNKAMLPWFFGHYTNGPQDAQNPRLNLLAANLANLPPTTIINAQIDPLRSDGEMLAQKLKAAGVTTTQKTFDGVNHEFFGMAAVVDKAMQAQQMAADALKQGFGG